MKSITLSLFMMLAFLTASVAQTAVIYETDFDMRALGATIHDQSSDGDITENQGIIWWNGPRYNDTGNVPGLMVNGTAVPQDPTDPAINYMRFGSDATITDGIPSNRHFRVSPSQPFVDGGKISITYTVHGGGGAIDIYDMTEGGLGLLGSVSTAGDSRVKRTAELVLPADFNGHKTIGFTRGNGVTFFAWDLKIETTDAGGDNGGDNDGDDVQGFYMNFNANPPAFPFDFTISDVTVTIDGIRSSSTQQPICGFDESFVVIERRNQTNYLELELNGISMAELHISGASSGSAPRTIQTVYLWNDATSEWDDISGDQSGIYTTFTNPTTNTTCHTTGITGLAVPDGSKIRIEFNTNLDSDKAILQNVRVSEIKIIPIADDAPPVLSDAKNILTASVTDMVSSEVESSTNVVNIIVAQGTDLSSIAPEFTLSEGASISPEDAQDFTSGPVVYTVTAEDGSTVEWTVSIAIVALSDAKAILTASVVGMISSEVESSTNEVSIAVPQGTDLSSIAPEFTLSEGASILPEDAQDFTSGSVVYTVTAEDGSTVEWTVSIAIVVLSDAKDILTASVTDMVSSEVENSTNMVSIVVPQGTDLSSIAPEFTLSEGASISPVDAQDFTSGSVVYTVTAEDGTSVEWTVSIALEDGSSIPENKKVAVWYVSENSLFLSNIHAGSVIQQVSLSGSVVGKGIAYGNSYELSLVSGVQIVRIISDNNVEVIKVVGK